jgi:hypothetical protein
LHNRAGHDAGDGIARARTPGDQAEADALDRLAVSLDSRFADAVNLILTTRSRVVVTGMGKSGMSAASWRRRWPPPARRRSSSTHPKPRMAIWAC